MKRKPNKLLTLFCFARADPVCVCFLKSILSVNLRPKLHMTKYGRLNTCVSLFFSHMFLFTDY